MKDEIKMLKVAKRIGKETPLKVKTTFLGAHAVPAGVRKEDYIKTVIHEMIPAVAEQKLADYIDVFCEEGFFNQAETEQIVEAGKRASMTPKIHANQLHRSGGAQIGVKTGAISVDHLENIGDEEIKLLRNTHDADCSSRRCILFEPSIPARAKDADGRIANRDKQQISTQAARSRATCRS